LKHLAAGTGALVVLLMLSASPSSITGHQDRDE
jgi:hypothetical protein